MAKKEGLSSDQKIRLKRLIGQALILQSQTEVLANEYALTKGRIQAMMAQADLETVTTDVAVASYVAGAKKTILNVGKLVQKLTYKEYVTISAPKLGEVRKILTEAQMGEITTEEIGPPYVTIRPRRVDDAGGVGEP